MPDRMESASPSQPNRTTVSQFASTRNRQRARIALVMVVMVGLGIAIMIRLFWMQLVTWSTIAQAPAQVADAAAPSVENTIPRGLIVDRNGELLAADHYVFRVTATPNVIPRQQWPAIADILDRVAGIPAARTLTALEKNANLANAVLAEVSMARGHALLDEKEARDDDLLYHIHATAIPRRFYPQRQLASQALGFVNLERTSFYGVESYYDRFLRQNGTDLAPGKWQSRDTLSPNVLRYVPQDGGKALVLSLDRSVQWIIEDELRLGLESFGAEAGTIIVMDPRTGAILGMANEPDYDPNQYDVYFRDHPEQLINTAVSSQYEPGSIFKVITYAAALDLNVIEPTTIFTDTGIIVIGQRAIRNSNYMASGQVSAADALAKSLNVVTVQVAERVGADRFYRYVQRFGFSESTDIDLAGEVAGQVKTPGTRFWSLSDLGTNSFGQGLAVTPIQMISAVAAIANHGRLMRPYIVEARVDSNQVLRTQPTAVRQVIAPATAITMTEMMIHTVEAGNPLARVPGYKVAGKSGTAQIPTPQGYTEDETIVSFVGFVPTDDPQFVILVKMDRPNPDVSPWAAYTAAPVFAKVAYRLLNLLNIPPDEQRLAQNQ